MRNDDSTRDKTNESGEEPSSVNRASFASLLIYEAVVAPFALILGWALGQHPLASFAWDGAAAVRGLIASLPMLAWLLVSLHWSFEPLERIKQYIDHHLLPVLKNCEWPDLALLSVVAGVGEEMLFRGVIQATLARSIGPVAAVAVASAVFGLFHPISVTYVIIVTGIGAYLGLVWVATGNLLTVMVAHAVYDFVALIALLHDRGTDRE